MVPAPSRSLSLSLSLCLLFAPSLPNPVYPSASIVGSFRYARPPFTLVNANAVSCFNFPSPHKTERRTCRPFCVLARFLPFSSARTPRTPSPPRSSFSSSLQIRYRARHCRSALAIPHERIARLPTRDAYHYHEPPHCLERNHGTGPAIGLAVE